MLRYLFIGEDGEMAASNHLDDEALEEHKMGILDIILLHEDGAELDGPSRLDEDRDWQPIEVIPEPPIIKDIEK